MARFEIVSEFKPAGDQPKAIEKLSKGFGEHKMQTLLGVTGSGKTFTMAGVIENVQRPTLVLAHNKTLAAQLYAEFKGLFPKNRVEYFVSYYDYYQPESYLPATDTYIEKDSKVNEKIEQMRVSATASLLSRPDTIIVASISCIYALGDPKNFEGMGFTLERGKNASRNDVLRKLLEIQYERNDVEIAPGRFRVRGNTIEFMQSFSPETVIRIELSGDKVESIIELSRLDMKKTGDADSVLVFPARHFVSPAEQMEKAIARIEKELKETLPKLGQLEAHRLKKRTLYDIEMMRELGYCKGIENYSAHFDGRNAGEPPFCLLDFFPKDFLLIIDESHQTLPQSRGMYHGDYTRKKALVEYGFRLPSAFDNRPLKFEEFSRYFNNVIFVSATPGDFELQQSGQIAEQVVRPTGLVDPKVEVRKREGQVHDLINEIRSTVESKNRVLVTTLTKRLAEELTEYLAKAGIRCRYMHSEIDTLERTEIIRELRIGRFDALVGINLLREGLDIPEVGLVAILDADREGFLRDKRSLIQTIGRAARNVESKVIMYADSMTESMRGAIAETDRRRGLQEEFNKRHGIVPKTVIKAIPEKQVEIRDIKHIPKQDMPNAIVELELKMREAAERLDFESAIEYRNRAEELKKRIN